MSPLVDQPQIQNVTNRIQNTRVRAASRSVVSANRAAPVVPDDPVTGGVGGAPGGAPYAVVPTSSGRSCSSQRTSGTSARANAATSPAAQRQPGPSARWAITGRNTSCPVELAAEKTPTTRPRCLTNQRLATIAPKTRASAPVPMPTANPHSSHSCHGEVITRVSPDPTATRTSAAATTRRIPNFSIRAAAKGAVRP